MNLKDYIKFFKENTSVKDIILIILAVISIIIWISGTVFAVEEEISWSSTSQSINDVQLKEIIIQNTSYDVSGENFYSYTGSNYSNVLQSLLNVNYLKAFIDLGDNKVLVLYGSSANMSLSSYQGNPLYYIVTGVNGYTFDFTNKTLTFFSGYVGGSDPNSDFSKIGWHINNSNISNEEFSSFAYQQRLIFDTFFMVLGPIYSTDNSLLVTSFSYEITGNNYNGINYSGNIILSETEESWETINLSESFYNSGDVFSYYVYAYEYSESGVQRDSIYKVHVSDVIFDSSSLYAPTFEEVNHAIKQIDGYMNYAYTLALFLNNSPVLIRSDLFIVDSKPIVMIPYFNVLYKYIYYGSYIDIGEIPSGDIGGGVISPSGDDTTLEGGISGIWQALVNLPENLLNGLIRLFIPPSTYFYNEGPVDPGLWQRMSSFFQEKLGFLYDVIVFIPNLLLSISNVIASYSEVWHIIVPDITIPELTGVEEFTILESFEWSPYDWVNSKPEFRNFYDLYLNIIDFFIYWSLVWLAADTLFGFFNIKQVTIDDVD